MVGAASPDAGPCGDEVGGQEAHGARERPFRRVAGWGVCQRVWTRSGRPAYLMYPARFMSRSTALWASDSALSTVEEPARAAEKNWPTFAPRPWNSGMATNCTPT